ncbi:MAG: polysaccharide biosynthesis C-terminal domain-containing protein, partial [Hyphomicrobiales bacterium]|nr:polysaccharide biosynthesis C-terminal domain-containing protein [Hyphomicrobiales bacterium]
MTTSSPIFRGFTSSRIGALIDIGGVMTLKGSAVVLSFTLFTLAAWIFGAHDFGTFSMLYSAVGLIAVFATSGQQMLLTRSWNEYSAQEDLPHLKGALIFAAVAFASVASIAGAVMFAVLHTLFPTVPAATVTIYMVLFALQLLTMHLVRTSIGIGAGDGVSNIIIVMLPIAYLLGCYFTESPGDLDAIFLFFAIGSGAVILIHLVLIAYMIRRLFPGFAAVTPRFDLAAWPARSLKLWLSNGLEASNQYVDVLIIGFLMNPSIAGAYFIISRLANIFAMAADAFYMFANRHVPGLYYRREFERLDHLLDLIAWATVAVIAAGIAVVIFGGQWMLSVFNEAYMPYHSVLVLLCVGTAAVTAAGPSAAILMLTGHESTNLKITATTLFMRVAGFFLLIPLFEVTGAIAATTISFVFMAAALRHS